MAYLYFRVSFNKARTEFGREREVKRMRGNRNGENKVWKLFGEWTSTRGRACIIIIYAWCRMGRYFVYFVFILIPHLIPNLRLQKLLQRHPFICKTFSPSRYLPLLSSQSTTFKTPERNKGSTTI